MNFKRIITALLFCFITSLLIAQESDFVNLNYSSPKSFTIREIQVTGSQFLDEFTIISLSGLKPGDEISIPGDDITGALKKLWGQKLVGNVEISIIEVEGNDVDLNIHLTERPRLSRFEIDGLKKSEIKDLEEKFGLIKGQVVSDAIVKNTQISVVKYLEEKGLYNNKIEVIKQKDPANENHILLYIKAEKGEKVKIEEIILNGVDASRTKAVKKQMKKTKQRNPLRVFKRSKFIKKEFKGDKKAIITYYNSLGHRDAKIEKDTVYRVGKKRIALELDVYEGQKYYFRNITWNGNHIHDTQTLDRILNIKKGDVYNQALLDTKLNFNQNGPDVSSLYLDNGYLFFNVTPVEVGVENDSIDVELRIYEGEQATINKVYVVGNTKTSDHVIMREIRTYPGQKFSRSDLIRTQREIAQLGYFDPEKIGIIPKPNPADGTVDIEYQVEEKPSDQLQLSGGWGGVGGLGFIGSLGLMFNNFSARNILKLRNWDPLPSGDGQRVNLRFQATGIRYQNYLVSFTEPWLGGRKPTSLNVSFSRTISNIPSRTDFTQIDGFFKITNVSVGIGKRITWPDNWFMLNNTLSFQNYNTSNFSFGLVNCQNCNSNNVFHTITLARPSSGPNPQFPTEGSDLTLSASFTPPYTLFNPARADMSPAESSKWLEYHKWMFDNSWFFRLTGNPKGNSLNLEQNKTERPLVLNVRTHFGAIVPYNKSVGLTPFERFKLGGSGMFMGFGNFGTDIVGLRGYGDQSILGKDGEDGVVFSKYVTELRFPIVTQGFATIFVLGFVEAGNTWSKHRDFNPFDLYRSAGAGVRIFMAAFGMIGVDWGYGFDQNRMPLDRRSNNTGEVHFTIGQMIR